MTVDEIVQRVRERSRRLASGLPVLQPPLGSDFSLNGVVPRAGELSAGCSARAAGAPRAGHDGFADPAHRGHAEPCRPDRLSRRPPAGRRCRCRGHRAARDRGGGRASRDSFVDVIGAVDHYRTGTGYEITPDRGHRHAGIHHPCGSARGRRRLRGAAGALPRREEPPASTAASGRAASGATTPCPTVSATSGARLPVC